MSRYLVVSSDCHAGLPPGHYRDYLDPQYREQYQANVKVQLDSARQMRRTMEIEEINRKWREGHERELTGAWDHEERLKVLSGDGIAVEVIFPDGLTENNAPPFGAGLGIGPRGGEHETQWAGARAHNRWLAEFCQMAPERRVGVAVVPATWDVDEAIVETRWAKQNGLGSIMIPVMWTPHDPYHHPKYDPLWATCQELEMPVNFHSGPAPQEEYWGAEGRVSEGRLEGGMGIFACEAVWTVARPLTFFIWGGVLERFPKLKVVITEATTTWAPSFIEHLDERYFDWHVTAKLGNYRKHLSLSPGEYFRRNIRMGTFFGRREAERRAQSGVECMMWGSDFPHPEGTWPQTHDMMLETFRGLPEDEIGAMLGENAADCYGLDTEKLAPIVAEIGPEKQIFQE